MARFDVYRSRNGGALSLDCQSDWLSHLTHRLVVPLAPPDQAPGHPIQGLNPTLLIDGSPYVMLTQFAVSIPVRDLGKPVAKLADDDHHIIHALDVLIGTA